MGIRTCKRELALALVMVLTLSGCASTARQDYLLCQSKKQIPDVDIINTSHLAAEALIQKSLSELNSSEPLLAASFANIDNLEQTSSFGRIISQQFATAFSDKGFTLVEMLLRKDVYIKQQGGEFLLSREVIALSEVHNAPVVIVGTYAVGKKSVFITAKIIDVRESTVLAAHDYQLPLGPDTKHLLKPDKQ
jgi:TolB-like protein